MEKRTRRKYSPEFKREAVELANSSGQKIAGVARDLGINATATRACPGEKGTGFFKKRGGRMAAPSFAKDGK